MPKKKPTSTEPTHLLYSVQGKAEKKHWGRVGAAWPHQDGNGFSLVLDCVPLSGRIQMRVPLQGEEGGAQ